MSSEEREGIIESLSVMLCRDKKYFESMGDERLLNEYDRMMKIY
jgi:hypothetical protein